MIEINYKNENDFVLFTKHITGDVKVTDIIKNQTENLWVSINIRENDLLDEIELMDIGEGKIRLLYSFSIDELIPSSEKQFQDVAEILRLNLNDNAEVICNIFNKKELFIVWGGPDAPEFKSELKLEYYIDNKISFVLLSMVITQNDLTDNFKVTDLVSNADKISVILQQIIDSIRLTIY